MMTSGNGFNGNLRAVIFTAIATAVLGIGAFVGSKALNAASAAELKTVEIRVEYLEKAAVKNDADHRLLLYKMDQLLEKVDEKHSKD